MTEINLNPIRKKIQYAKKDYKKAEIDIKGFKDGIRELEMSIDKYLKEASELKFELAK